jgi:hypothetical protein
VGAASVGVSMDASSVDASDPIPTPTGDAGVTLVVGDAGLTTNPMAGGIAYVGSSVPQPNPFPPWYPNPAPPSGCNYSATTTFTCPSALPEQIRCSSASAVSLLPSACQVVQSLPGFSQYDVCCQGGAPSGGAFQ